MRQKLIKRRNDVFLVNNRVRHAAHDIAVSPKYRLAAFADENLNDEIKVADDVIAALRKREGHDIAADRSRDGNSIPVCADKIALSACATQIHFLSTSVERKLEDMRVLVV